MANKIYSCALAVLFCAVITYGKGQKPEINPLPRGYYIVVAAYFENQEDYAQRYADKVNEGGLHAKIGLDAKRKLYVVYLDQYSDFDESIGQMLKVRKEGTFAKAWVRVIKDGTENTEVAAQQETPKVKAEPETVVTSKKEEPKAVVEEKKEEVKPVDPPKAVVAPAAITEVVDNPMPKPVFRPQTLTNTPVFLSLFNSTNNQVIDGYVDVVDAENARLITSVKGNSYVNLPNPGSKSGQLSLISKTFGFRNEQHELHFKNTEADTVQPYVDLVGNFYMVNFGLSQIHKGDISTLYNVYFYNDAAIMLPDSKYQLNTLLQLMKDNPTFKIILHGHTNGAGGGKIIYMGSSKDFFHVTKDVKQGSGSARELSEARAEVIRDWLVEQGIATERLTVKGWGGSRMIHDKNSVHARKNIRVDVEVIDE